MANTITRWAPRRDLLGFQDEINRLFDSFWTRGNLVPSEFQGTWLPPVDVEETESHFIVRMDLPGVDPKNIKINLLGDTLTVRGERHSEREEEGKGNLTRTERFTGMFERAFGLGAPVQADRVKANYRDGVLEIQIPKADEARTREITIDVASNR